MTSKLHPSRIQVIPIHTTHGVSCLSRRHIYEQSDCGISCIPFIQNLIYILHGMKSAQNVNFLPNVDLFDHLRIPANFKNWDLCTNAIKHKYCLGQKQFPYFPCCLNDRWQCLSIARDLTNLTFLVRFHF